LDITSFAVISAEGVLYGAGIMTIQDLIDLCEKRIVCLQSLKQSSIAIGDINGVIAWDQQLATITITLNALRSLL
jgi:hypothetical protein